MTESCDLSLRLSSVNRIVRQMQYIIMNMRAIKREKVIENHEKIRLSSAMSIPISAGIIEDPMQAPTTKQETILPLKGNWHSMYPNMDPQVDDNPIPVNVQHAQKTASFVSTTQSRIVPTMVRDILKIRTVSDPKIPERKTAQSLNDVKAIQ